MGIELKATLKTRKLLILLNEKNGKNTRFAQLRYTPGTQPAYPEVGDASLRRECNHFPNRLHRAFTSIPMP